MTDYVEDNQRDECLQALLQQPENKVCFDCQSKNPKWCSANIGIFLCYQCTGSHRSMGVHISFVRSLKMDRWKLRELKQMEFGGNKLAKNFYEKNGMMKQGQKPDHTNPALTRYKNQLRLQAEQVAGIKTNSTPEDASSKDFSQISQSNNTGLKQEESKFQQKTDSVAVKKPRAFVADDDIFDFSGMQKVIDQPKNDKLVANNLESIISVNKRVSVGSNSSLKNKKLDEDFQLGNYFNGKTAAPVNLNAKKLDINFDGDDFFNSFDPNTQIVAQQPSIEKSKSIDIGKKDNESGCLKFGQNIKLDEKSKSSIINDIEKEDLSKPEPSPKGEQKSVSGQSVSDDDVQARYEALVKSGATAISSEMLFGHQPTNSSQTTSGQGRWSTPASLSSIGERLQDHITARQSVGSGGSGNVGYISGAKDTILSYAPGAMGKASNAKDAALDWITNMTSSTNNPDAHSKDGQDSLHNQ